MSHRPVGGSKHDRLGPSIWAAGAPARLLKFSLTRTFTSTRFVDDSMIFQINHAVAVAVLFVRSGRHHQWDLSWALFSSPQKSKSFRDFLSHRILRALYIDENKN